MVHNAARLGDTSNRDLPSARLWDG